MFKGGCKHPVTPGSRILIRSDAEFTVYGIVNGVRDLILGPRASTDRQCRFLVPWNCRCIEVTTRKTGKFHIDIAPPDPPRKEIPDPTPVEVPIEMKEGPGLVEEMVHRLVDQALSRQAQSHGKETFAQADDFDVPDEEEWRSPYELQDMQEDFPLEPARNEPPGEQNDAQASPAPEVATPQKENAEKPDTPPA